MKSTLSWAFTTWLALVALQALTSKSASGRVAQALGDVDRLLERALDPTVPAIPDLRDGAKTKQRAHVTTPTTPTNPSMTSPRLPVPAGVQRPV